jgi:hypothetical protein
MWPSVVFREHWPVSQRMIAEMGEHIVTVFLACQITIKNVQVQLIDELRTAILQEWQQFPQERLRSLVRSMTRCVTELLNKRGGYTRTVKTIK